MKTGQYFIIVLKLTLKKLHEQDINVSAIYNIIRMKETW